MANEQEGHTPEDGDAAEAAQASPCDALVVSRADLEQRMLGVHVARISEMPRLQLYLDQVLTFVNGELSFMTVPGEQLLTGPMVNNYVKQHVIPAPAGKRYTRRHLASLIFVCAFKQILSIAQLVELKQMCEDGGVDMPRAYDDLCAWLESALVREFRARDATDGLDSPAATACDVRFYDEAGDEVADDVASLFSASVACIAEKVYVEQMLLASKHA